MKYQIEIDIDEEEFSHLGVYADEEENLDLIEEAYHHDNNSTHATFPNTAAYILNQVYNEVKNVKEYETTSK